MVQDLGHIVVKGYAFRVKGVGCMVKDSGFTVRG